MEPNSENIYPGANASPQKLIFLACEYQRAAHSLFTRVKPGDPVSRAPAFLCAIHATDLFLNAFLLSKGSTPEHIRSYHHDLTKKWELAGQRGLLLRKKTIEHLTKLTKDREYLVSRYEPDLSKCLSQINRVSATLNEISNKVVSLVLKEPETGKKNAA